MMQEIIVGIIFLIAVGYIGKLAFGAFKGDSGCAKGCDGACSSLDVEHIEKSYKSKA